MKTTPFFILFFLSAFLLTNTNLSAADPFNPEDSNFAFWVPKLPADAVMPSAEAVNQVRSWCENVFGGKAESGLGARPLTSQLPFSFQFDGQSSRDFLTNWTFKTEKIDTFHTVYSWKDPKTGLLVSAKVRLFETFAAADWVLTFKNTSGQNSPILEAVLPLDTNFLLGLENEPLALHTLLGDSCNETSWRPIVHSIQEGAEPFVTAPVGGRSSNGAFPFWNLARNQANDDSPLEGIFFACGWSGQWRAEFAKPKPLEASVRIGMEKIRTILRPGEEIRSPRILLMPWNSDRLTAQVLFRRLLMFEYAPKDAGGNPQEIGLIGQCFDRYYRKRPGWEKYEGQVEFAKRLKEAGCTRYWFDAAWFPVGFPNGVGNWFSDKTNFPEGLEALGQTIKDLNMTFVLWFEPERVAQNTEIANEHPQYVFGGEKGGLFKLNDPEARSFLTDLLSRRITEFKVDVYRNDFNINPLSFWRANDEENRQGMTEIRYVEGLYEMWNRLLSEHPGLWIDDCASGGRRIDLEMLAISIPLWRSDTCCRPDHPHWDQNQTLGLAQYLPLFSSVAWDSSPYTFRSAANPGCIMQYNFLDDDYDPAETKKSVDEARTYQKFWYGDFYPLTKVSTENDGMTAWQLHREDLNAGLIYVFRQENALRGELNFRLHAIDPVAEYQLRFKSGYETDKTITVSGSDFQNYSVNIPKSKSTLVIEYQKK